jgi:hypothetical protein
MGGVTWIYFPSVDFNIRRYSAIRNCVEGPPLCDLFSKGNFLRYYRIAREIFCTSPPACKAGDSISRDWGLHAAVQRLSRRVYNARDITTGASHFSLICHLQNPPFSWLRKISDRRWSCHSQIYPRRSNNASQARRWISLFELSPASNCLDLTWHDTFYGPCHVTSVLKLLFSDKEIYCSILSQAMAMNTNLI